MNNFKSANDIVIKNKLGYYTLKNVPSKKELKNYYQKKYYQAEEKYSSLYTKDELENIKNKLDLKYTVISNYFSKETSRERSLLELGAGEGWTLKFFKDKKWQTTGIDFSDFGVQTHNRDVLGSLIVGDLQEEVRNLTKSKKTFDLVWLDNVLEHVLDPEQLLKDCRKLVKLKGLLVIEVPNDFSPLQNYLFSKGFVNKPYWIVVPDHISYFSAESLSSLCIDTGFKSVDTIADFPIDFFLLNRHTNYVKSKKVGKDCHLARVKIENFISSQNPNKALNFYREMAKLSLGRQIIAFFKPT